MKKVKVEKEKCIGCGACVAIDSTHFDFDNETGLSKVISQNDIENSKVQEAIDSCPVGAIEMFDGCDNKDCSCNPCECDNCTCNHDESDKNC